MATTFQRAGLAALVGLAALLIRPAPLFAQTLPDEPMAIATIAPRPSDAPASYADALAAWKRPEDVARFIGATFVYDRGRALALADAPGQGRRLPVHTPEALFADGRGVCVDLARFGVETLNRLDARHAARYLMIEFEPVVVQGRTLRRHWVAVFERDGALWVYADSSRPGHVAGPYAALDAFVADYARLRGRTIVSWRERAGFERTRRAAKARA
jgi:hypothetical protein